MSTLTATKAPPGNSGGHLSLEHKLPLLMTGVLVVVLAASLAITYRTLERSARQTTETRLSRAAIRLAAAVGRSATQHIVLQHEAASDSNVMRLMRRAAERSSGAARGTGRQSPPGDSTATVAAARAALSRLVTITDSGLPIELWTEDGRRVLRIGGDSLAVTQTQDPPEAAGWRGDHGAVPRADSARVTEFYAVDGRVYFDITLPLYDGGRRIGYLTEQHRVAATAQSAQGLRELIGEDVTGYLRNRTGAFWSTLGGKPSAPLEPVDSTDDVIAAFRPATGQLLAATAAIPGTPWAIVLELPNSVVLARPRQTTMRLGLLSLLLVAASAALSWLISRRITRPIAALSEAAEALAHGDYSSPVDDSGGDELGRLAKSFNHMRRELGTTHQELEEQIEGAHAVAEELERANEQLIQAKDAAEQANRAKSDFLAVMSHELRTPLNAIGGYAQLIDLGVHGPVTDAQRDALARITRSQQRLLTLINDVLNFVKLDAGQVQYERADVQLDDALSGLATIIRPQVRAKGLHFSYVPCGPGLTAYADRDKVQQVVLNLLLNAVKFTPTGGSITVACDGSEAEARIHVRDTGVGISPERTPTIFDPFVQAERALSRPHDGIGLGLAISRDLARGMGGELAVESVPGQGSTFTLTLPRAAPVTTTATP